MKNMISNKNSQSPSPRGTYTNTRSVVEKSWIEIANLKWVYLGGGEGLLDCGGGGRGGDRPRLAGSAELHNKNTTLSIWTEKYKLY